MDPLISQFLNMNLNEYNNSAHDSSGPSNKKLAMTPRAGKQLPINLVSEWQNCLIIDQCIYQLT
jgi:hypothetical protein